jgi:hypothetical protein
MKRYITNSHLALYKTRVAATLGVDFVVRLSAGTKFIILESTDWHRKVLSGNQVGWIWVSDGMLASMEVKES